MGRVVNLSGCWYATDMLHAHKNPPPEPLKGALRADDDIFGELLDEHMAELKKKHMGDPVKKTGIYAIGIDLSQVGDHTAKVMIGG